MPWPSTISSFSNPIPSDRLNSPSHSSVETAQNTGLTELQTYIGVTTGVNASAVGTLLYNIMAPGSNGGGHVQTANKGGTGQTTFTKGDILVAQSSSVLTKLAVGQDTYILKANSVAATGIEWSQDSRPKVFASGSILQLADNVTETSIFSTTIPGSTIGTSNAVRSTFFISNAVFEGPDNITLRAKYGSTSVLTIVLSGNDANASNLSGTVEYRLIGRNHPSSQLAIMSATISQQRPQITTPSLFGTVTMVNPNVNVDSGAAQTLGVTAQWSDNELTGASFLGVIVEKVI